ncbi:MAG: hypothetical protein A3F54_00135 [Candidatus Kerfeldbacteria bacterium RIFCSPHIGHO2_12_FULL_48_17]|uniref:Uncharacterized protein n=1 Tax=Candidatus Kerfeldbacteria bacterium RIFCSPHIGHO2_12_FULL_48_17 TaxID=1798542 RepID=A0A1G2B812_9BACT|nr:MAG: hypothetical protein A3F54_00135 [Candidatus Kerfeldbacteria bacterium RIFCSPHIGHO2_12_FULL_48_17]
MVDAPESIPEAPHFTEQDKQEQRAAEMEMVKQVQEDIAEHESSPESPVEAVAEGVGFDADEGSQKDTDAWREQYQKSIVHSEVAVRKGQEYPVHYVTKESTAPMFGYADGLAAHVREDLSPRVKKFVKEHELYHLRDEATWGGMIGSEIRANIVPGLKDPIGLLATIFASLTRERLSFYFDRYVRRNY